MIDRIEQSMSAERDSFIRRYVERRQEVSLGQGQQGKDVEGPQGNGVGGRVKKLERGGADKLGGGGDKDASFYDDEELVQICRDLLIAGSETTATVINWALILLANHRDLQLRLRDVINSVVPRDRLPCLDDVTSLASVEAALLEVMRLKTTLPLSLVHSAYRNTEVMGYHVPEGTRVCTACVFMYSIQCAAAVSIFDMCA